MRWVSLLSLLVIAWCGSPALRAQTTAFTYQGRLNDSGTPANGTYDLRFIIYDGNGAPIFHQTGAAGTTQTVTGAPPLDVVIGNGIGVGVAFRGQPIDVAPFTHGNIARFSLK